MRLERGHGLPECCKGTRLIGKTDTQANKQKMTRTIGGSHMHFVENHETPLGPEQQVQDRFSLVRTVARCRHHVVRRHSDSSRKASLLPL